MKLPTKVLPEGLRNVLKENGFRKREISVSVGNSARVTGRDHAPEYDNFDYSFTVMYDMNGGRHDLQSGMKPHESKTVPVNNNEILIDGDKHHNYAVLTMTQEMYDSMKPAESKVAAEIKSLEQRVAGSYIDELEDGMKKLEDALKHLDKSDSTRKMKEDLEHLRKDYDKFMLEVMNTVEPL